jgi:hypothetical protein
MENAVKFLSIIFAAIFIFSAADLCYCDDSSDDVKKFRGYVENIDWVGSLLVVDGGDPMTFYVPSGMEIRCGTEKVSLSDLSVGDPVLVRYKDSSQGVHKAVSITVNKPFLEY